MKGIKFDNNKLDWLLIPYEAIIEVIKVLMCGLCKYARDNWKIVPEARLRYRKSVMRHSTEYCLNNETTDPDYNLHHLAHLICCCLFLIWFDIQDKIFIPFTPNYNEIEERYKKQKEEALLEGDK